MRKSLSEIKNLPIYEKDVQAVGKSESEVFAGMSNALKRKSNKNLFFTKQDTKIIGRNSFEKRNSDAVITKSYKEFVVIGYIILHDKFGFGQKRIVRLQELLKQYLDADHDKLFV